MMMSVSMTGDYGIASFVSNKGEIEDVIVADYSHEFILSDPLVGEIANAIEAECPGRVVDVNTVVYRSDGSIRTDLDIVLDDMIIQVKQGGGKGIVRQMMESQDYSGKTTIGFVTKPKKTIVNNAENQGYKIFADVYEMIEYIKNYKE